MASRIIALALAVALVLAAGTVVAQRGRGGPGVGRGMGSGMGMMADGPCGLGLGLGMGGTAAKELNLTAAQKTKLQTITDQFLADTKATRAEMQTTLKELAGLWTADKPNESAIRSKIGEVDRLRASIRDAMVKRAFAAMRVLTPAQRTKLRDLVKNRQGFGMGLGCGLGMGCGMAGASCYLMGGPGSRPGGVGAGRGPRGTGK